MLFLVDQFDYILMPVLKNGMVFELGMNVSWRGEIDDFEIVRKAVILNIALLCSREESE